MAKQSLLQKGFKSQAERIALTYRQEQGIPVHCFLDAFKLAEYMNIIVCGLDEFGHIEATKFSKHEEWSALTMPNCLEQTVIIHNTNHAPVRQQSNIMHELAHIILEHRIPEHYLSLNLPEDMRYCNELQEEEAVTLGSTLQIPREGLVWCLKQKMDNATIAEYYNASLEMVKFRINTTGVKQQLKYLFV